MAAQGGEDPRLEAAMQETFAELAQGGQGVSPSEVAKPARQRPARRRSADDGNWFDQDQDQPQQQRQQRQQPARRTQGERAAETILDEVDTDDAEDTPSGGAQRDSRGRFLPSRADTDEDDDDVASDSDEDDEEDDVRPSTGGRRVAAEADEADDADGATRSEGRRQTDDDEDEGDQPRQQRGRRRFPREVRQEIEKQVQAQVGKIVEERDRLRQAASQQQAEESEAIGTLVRAIGTQEERARLQERVNNTRLPLEQRNQAAALLNRYTQNEKYVRTYRTALLADIRHQQATDDHKVMQELAKYQIHLDPVIVAEGKRDKTLIHAVRQGILLERKRQQAEIAKLQRSQQTRGGYADQRAVSNGQFGRDSMASSNGRRANGRVAVVDRLRRSMGFDRGIGAGSQVAAPTDETLRKLRDGEITLRDLGLG